MPKIGFPMPTEKNQFQILNPHPKKHVFIKNMVLKEKNTKKTLSKSHELIVCMQN